MTDSEDKTTRTRITRATAVVVAIVACVVGFSNFADAIANIIDRACVIFRLRSEPHLVPSRLWGSDGADGVRRTLGDARNPDHTFGLFIDIQAGFIREELNKDVFLRTLAWNGASAGEGAEVKAAAWEPSSEKTGGTTLPLGWIALLTFPNEPRVDQVVEISVGVKKWQVKLGRLTWLRSKQFSPSGEFWNYAFAGLTLPVSDFDWCIIERARLFKGADPGVSLLEISIRNGSDETVLLDELAIRASHPRLDRNPMCGSSDQPQVVKLSWEALYETGEGATTMLSSTEIVLDGALVYNLGRCNDLGFSVKVPTDAEVPPHGVVSLKLKVVEQGHFDPVAARGKLRERLRKSATRSLEDAGVAVLLSPSMEGEGSAPRYLREWKEFRVEVNPRSSLYPVLPSFVDVERGPLPVGAE